MPANKHPTFQKVFGIIPCENRTGNSFVEPIVEPGNFKCENGKWACSRAYELSLPAGKSARPQLAGIGAREQRKRGFPNH